MIDSTLLHDIDIILSYFKDAPAQSVESLIYKRYAKLKENLQQEELTTNPIKGSVKAYLDAYNDWDNPILATMSAVEAKIELIL